MSKKASTKPKRKALGRGLSSLIGGAAASASIKAPVKKEVKEPAPTKKKSFKEEVKEESAPSQNESAKASTKEKLSKAGEKTSLNAVGFSYLKISSLVPFKDQPRQSFSEKELIELSTSIKEQGLLQPILVRPLKTEKAGEERFEIVAGERRYRASKLAGLTQVPVHIKPFSEKEAFAISIVENIQREDLNPIEEAKAYKKLMDDFGESQEGIAKAVGKERSTVANMIRLLQLGEEVLVYLQTGKLSAGHGRAILKAPKSKQAMLAQKALAENLSVRALEREASEVAEGGASKQGSKERPTDAKQKSKLRTLQVIELENSLRRKLGTKVSLESQNGEKGELKISFYSRAELESLVGKLGV